MGIVDTKDTPLHQAAEHQRVECMKRLLAGGAQVNVADEASNGIYPLHSACSSGSVECVKELKEAGADVCAVTKNGDQPIHYAAGGGHVEC
eukprot:3105524-Rhodomonas_salina.1